MILVRIRKARSKSIVACRGRGQGKGCEVGGGRGAEAARGACTHHPYAQPFRSAVLPPPPQVFDELRAAVEHHLVQAGRHRTIINMHKQKLQHEVALDKMRGAAASAAARSSSGEEWFVSAPRAAQAPPKRSRAEIEEDLSDWADMFASASDDSSDSEEEGEDDALYVRTLGQLGATERVRVRDIDGLIDDEPIPLAHQPHHAQLHIQAHVSAPLLPLRPRPVSPTNKCKRSV